METDRRAIVTITPSPSVDRTYHLATLRPGQLHRARAVLSEPSGKGVNVGRVLRRLGVPAHLVLTAGGGEGRLLGELLAAVAERDNGELRVDVVPVAGPTRVNVTLVVDGEEPTKVNEPGTALTPGEADQLVGRARQALRGARWLACCGALPVDTDPGLVTRLVEAGHAEGVPVAVDGSGAALAAAVSARADLLKPNRDELAELTGRPVATVDDAAVAAAEVRALTGGTVLVSLGGDGALLLGPAGAWHAATPPIAPVNTTGAGDALLAGYLARDDADPPARLAYAVSIGASACLAKATAELPDVLVDPARVQVRKLPEIAR
ncbi:MAG: hexose kinase [Micromonosporaceae bacterium]|nr:hexose kinase [Micromonosporaceae bacterium]